MKRNLFILYVFLFAGFAAFSAKQLGIDNPPARECPKEGRQKVGKPPLTQSQKTFNLKKNQSATEPMDNPEIVHFKDLLQGTSRVNDRDDWNEGVYVEIRDAYLIDYKEQGGESCNCYYADTDKKTWGDVHINIGTKEIMERGNNDYYMIVEITPSYKRIHPDYLSHLSSLKKKKVTIRGYLFYDEEHERNSVNYCQSCSDRGVWRKSCWEIHPVTYIGSSN